MGMLPDWQIQREIKIEPPADSTLLRFVDIDGDFCRIHPTVLPWPKPWNTWKSRATLSRSVWANPPYARCGIIVNVTPLEPECRGRVTIEISNTTPLPAKIYSGEGIAQILFRRVEEVCRTSYADKKGKYQDQKGPTLPFVTGDTVPTSLRGLQWHLLQRILPPVVFTRAYSL